MSDKTPKRSLSQASNVAGFSPIILPVSPAAASPQKNLTGLPRVARDLVADLYNNIQRWNDIHIKGANIVKEIASIKADNVGKYPEPLDGLTRDLYTLVQKLNSYVVVFNDLCNQIEALEKLDKVGSPLFITLKIGDMSHLFKVIGDAYCNEFKIKTTILESIAHSKSKNEAMYWAAYWTYQTHITVDVSLKLKALLIETGHHKIT